MAFDDSYAEITDTSVKALRALIARAGLNSCDCVEKHELHARAEEAAALLRDGLSTPPASPPLRPTGGIHARPDLMGVEAVSFNDMARASKVQRVPQLLNDDEIAAVEALAQHIGWHQINPAGKTNWKTCYLNAEHAFSLHLPEIKAKVFAAARKVDEQCWGVMRGTSQLGMRCIEYHQVGVGGGLPWIHHRDWGSLLTVDIMLSPRADFEGGTFQTSTVEGTLQPHEPFERGDALCFVSHKPHNVAPVTRGTRRVLILEIWEGEDRPCRARCNTAIGACTCAYDSERWESQSAVNVQ